MKKLRVLQSFSPIGILFLIIIIKTFPSEMETGFDKAIQTDSQPEQLLVYIEKKSYINEKQFNLYLQELKSEKELVTCFQILQNQIEKSTILIEKLKNILDTDLLKIDDNEEFKTFDNKIIQLKSHINTSILENNIKSFYKANSTKIIGTCLFYLSEKINFIVGSFLKLYTDLKYLNSPMPIFELFKFVQPSIEKNSRNFTQQIYEIQNNKIAECLIYLSAQIEEIIFILNGLQSRVKYSKKDFSKSTE